MTVNSSSSAELPLVRVAAIGRVDVVAEQRDDVDVRGQADVTHVGSTTTISSPSGRLKIRVPAGTDLIIGTLKGRVAVDGDVGKLCIVTESGTVAIKRAQSTDVRSVSGRIDIEETDGHCRVRSESGKVSVASCHHADVATTSGTIALRDVRGTVHAHCTSGRINIEMATANDIEAETVTGRIAVSLPRGVRAFRSEAGDGQATPDDADCTVFARSVSGRIDVGNR